MVRTAVRGVVLALSLAGAPGPLLAEGPALSRHDLLAAPLAAVHGTEGCVFCHPAAGGRRAVASPVWVGDAAGDGYRVFGQRADGQASLPRGRGPAGTSMVCQSCHDGAIAGDMHGTRSTAAAARAEPGDAHPVGVSYGAAAGPSSAPGGRGSGYAPAVGDTVNGELPLYDGAVECATCHEPHAQGPGPSLRKSNRGSALCLTCHRKNVNS